MGKWGFGFGGYSGFYYVNTYDLKSRPLYELEALTLREALPGHHLQIELQYELKNLLPFRRFFISQAFAEGWALYAERLGLEVDFYQDPYSDFGRLTYEISRACRLVVDTRMYMAANTNLTLRSIENDIDRFIAWPAQALTNCLVKAMAKQQIVLRQQK